jgi:hypothetical protein
MQLSRENWTSELTPIKTVHPGLVDLSSASELVACYSVSQWHPSCTLVFTPQCTKTNSRLVSSRCFRYKIQSTVENQIRKKTAHDPERKHRTEEMNLKEKTSSIVSYSQKILQ